jgi:hypothetical protein
VADKDFYQLLDVGPDASLDEVKRAFRQQIARYHPDKVQHLGLEFQAMAAGRAAELTAAYRVLSDPACRAEYDLAVAEGAPPSSPVVAPTLEAREGGQPPAPAAVPVVAEAQHPHQFTRERASRDELVRKATLARIRQALQALGGYEETLFRGFDLSFAPKSTLFARNAGPRFLARFVGAVNPESVADTWVLVGRVNRPPGEKACVFLAGPTMSSSRDLAGAIAAQRRGPQRGTTPILIPIDARTWDAHVPLDAPPMAKELLARLRTG